MRVKTVSYRNVVASKHIKRENHRFHLTLVAQKLSIFAYKLPIALILIRVIPKIILQKLATKPTMPMTSYLITIITDHHQTCLKMRARDKRIAIE